MNKYGTDTAEQQKVEDFAAGRSGQDLSGSPDSGEPLQGLPLIRAWASEAKDIIELWQGYLSSDRDESIDLTEISAIKKSMKSLQDGLTEYLFEGDAQLLRAAPDAWQGIKTHWILIKLNFDTFMTQVVYYRDWMIQIDKRGDQITDPMAMRKMARAMRDDTCNIVDLYSKLAGKLLPVIKEILEFP